MAVHDTIGDFITLIRNGYLASKDECVVSYSKLRSGIAKILKEEGYIQDYTEGDGVKKTLTLKLKYVDGNPALIGIKRHSKPGCRLYYGANEIPRILNGLGVAIVTTSKGIMKGKTAAQQNVGGELLCEVW